MIQVVIPAGGLGGGCRPIVTHLGKDLAIPFHRPTIDEEEIAAVQEVVSAGWLTIGAKAMEFERQFAA